jgi:hypothetical protein
LVTRWLSMIIWWTSAIFSSVAAACEGTGHSSSPGLSLPCFILATHSCIWWYIIMQGLHDISLPSISCSSDVQDNSCVLNSLHL